jgi:hypothetical protein
MSIIGRVSAILLIVFMALALVACQGGGNGQSTSTSNPPTGLPNSQTTAVPMSASCNSAAALGGHEYRGAASPTGRVLWAYVEDDIASAGTHNTKIRWRADGHGVPRIIATGPTQQTVSPDQGVLFHVSSDWNEPGTDEWGTNWQLPVSGCWTFEFTRDDMSGKLALQYGIP